MNNNNFGEQLSRDMAEKEKRMASMPDTQRMGQTFYDSLFNGAKVALPFKRFDKDLPALYKEDEGNAGFDLFARLSEPVTLAPGEICNIPLNVATDIPIFGVGLLFQRSSTYRKWKVKLTNGVGVIDSIFNGDGDEWSGDFKNESNEFVTVNPGDKICQAVFFSLLPVVPMEVDHLGNPDRGGYGTSFNNANDIK